MPSATHSEPRAAPTHGRVHMLILLGVLMVALLVGVLWASGIATEPGPASVGQPAYQLPDHGTSDTAARP